MAGTDDDMTIEPANAMPAKRLNLLFILCLLMQSHGFFSAEGCGNDKTVKYI